MCTTRYESNVKISLQMPQVFVTFQAVVSPLLPLGSTKTPFLIFGQGNCLFVCLFVCQQGGFCCLRSPPTPPSCIASSPPLPLISYPPSPPLGSSPPLPLHSCSWTRVRRHCCRCPSRSRATTPPPPSPPCWSPSSPNWKKLMRTTFMNP